MKSIIQVVTISGQLIDSEVYEMETGLTILESHEVSLNYETQDMNLINYIVKNEQRGTMVDGDNKEGYTVTIKCDVKNIKHMLDTKELKSQSIVLVSPVNRNAEQVLIYLVSPDLCSLAFRKSLSA